VKKISLLTLGAALIAVPVLAAPGGAKADADGNGVLTRAEVQTNATAMFAKMDANGDGKVDQADRAAKRTEMQAKAFERFDANRAERGEKRAEAGEPGKRGPGMRGHHGKRGGHHGMRGGMMMKADANGDKAISAAEFQTAALARFDAADANKDGQVTADERQAQRAAKKEKRAEWRAKRAAPAAAPAN